MAGSFQSFEASDLALGKPGLHWLPTSATVGDALKALKDFNVKEISVWSCPMDSDSAFVRSRALTRVNVSGNECQNPRCVGKVNVLDVICYLARDECLQKYESAVLDLVSVLLAGASRNSVKFVDAETSLYEVFKLILEGTQYLVVPLDIRRCKNLTYTGSRKLGQSALKLSVCAADALLSKSHCRSHYCWLTQEDVVRFLLGWIGVFSSLSMKSIENLGIINMDFLSVHANANAATALPLIHQASQSMSAVAVVEGSCMFQHIDDNTLGPKLVGEISLSTLKNCDQSAALALSKFSVTDFLSFTQHGSSSKGLEDLAESGLSQKMLAVNLFSAYGTDPVTLDCSSQEASGNDIYEVSSTDESLGSSSDESNSSVLPKKSCSSPKGHTPPITCHPWSSLVAVMAQTLAHRTTYIWVIDNDRTLIGIVTYHDIIHVLLNHLGSSE